MYFSCQKWRDHDTTEQQTSKDPTLIRILGGVWKFFGDGMIDAIANTTKDVDHMPMTLYHIMMTGSDPLIFYAGFSENSQYQKMEGGQ